MRKAGKVAAAACHAVRQKDDAAVLVGGLKAGAALQKCDCGVQCALYVRWVLCAEHADDLACQLGRGVRRACVKAAGVDDLCICRLCCLIQCQIGRVVAVRGDQPRGAVPFAQPQRPAQRGADVGNHPDGKNVHRDARHVAAS